MELEPEDVAKFSEALDRWVSTLDKVSGQKNSTVGNTTITINAGGVGVMVILVLASFVLGIATFSAYSSSGRINNIERRQDRQDDYLQAIYSIAPQLKPKETQK